MSGRIVRKPTTAEDWARSDAYHNSFLIPQDDALDGSLRYSKEQGLPNIAVSVAQGKLLHLLAKSIGAKRILEVGTLGGYVLLMAYSFIPRFNADPKTLSTDTPLSGWPVHSQRVDPSSHWSLIRTMRRCVSACSSNP